MCRSLMELDAVAQQCGWFGWSRGPNDYLEYTCGCDGHVIYVWPQSDDPTYYPDLCDTIRGCRT